MAKIIVNNPRQVINGGAKKYYFKVKGLGGPKGDKGDKGDTGSRGPQGEPGNAATVDVGSTTTLPVGQDATVENVGTQYNAVLNFGIPQGPRGPQGVKGDPGEPGPRGVQGERGTNATVSIGTTSTLNPGSQATVYNSGTDSNAVLNFGIPKGEKGDTGNQGPTGPAGQNFTPTIVTELPETGDSSKLYLTPKAHTTSTATGNPIEATITAQAGQLESFQLDGDTFQQTYTGKNLYDGTIYKYWCVINAQGGEIPSDGAVITNAVQVEPDTTYTASVAFMDSAGDKYLRVAIYTSDMTFISRPSSLDAGEPVTFTTPSNARYIRLSYYTPASNAQLELGSTATSYEPFVGGQPSPSPEYPQQIQTVTGTQTISINGTDYPLDLGSIELCKLGTYQDYIYKDGDSWKVHKAVGKAELWKGTNWRRLDTATIGEHRFSVKVSNTDVPVSRTSSELIPLDSNYWPVCTRLQTYQQVQGISTTSIGDISEESFVAFVDSLKTSDVDGWRAWLTAKKPVVYYQSTTPTDTAITDTNLIAQLEAIRTASLQNGTNTITNTATGMNLAGDMEIGYFGFNPTNRYDKFIWLDLNNNYEQIGS